jgi:predicted DNA-binding protein
MSDRIQEFDNDINVMPAILWQYENADKFVRLIQKQQAWIEENHNKFWRDWYRDVFDIDTANDFGLSVWARILDVNLYVGVEPTTGNGSWGFGPNRQNFGNGGFGRNRSGNICLSLEQKRMVIKLRLAQLLTRPTAYYINEVLESVVNTEDEKVYAYDTLDMEFIVYVFNYQPSSQTQFILRNYDLLPRPSGVGVQWIVEKRPAWGFGPYRKNFNNGTFGA